MKTDVNKQPTVTIDYFSDLLCVWAYLAQVRVDELRRSFGDRVRVKQHFVPVFGSTRRRIAERWGDRGGLQGYAAHVREVADRFDDAQLHPDVWTAMQPAGSFSAHTFVKAAELLADESAIRSDPVAAFDGRSVVEELSWQLRLAFFREARDIARLEVQLDVARLLGLPLDQLRGPLEDGRAIAALAEDHEIAAENQITGSPTFLLNEGRQKLYGNVGYRVIEANVQELLRDDRESASWC
jgi:predicted DsbA family dithiol-disulfide isomerase